MRDCGPKGLHVLFVRQEVTPETGFHLSTFFVCVTLPSLLRDHLHLHATLILPEGQTEEENSVHTSSKKYSQFFENL